MKCSHCAAENKDAAKFCAKCGQSLATPSAQNENSMPCPHCGATLKNGAKFCGKCGNSTTAAEQKEALPTPVAVDIAHPAMEVAIEVPQTAPVTEGKPVQPLPESIIETVKPVIPVAEIKIPPPPDEKLVIEAVANESQQPLRKVSQTHIAAGLAVLVIAIGVGGYFLMKGKPSNVANEAALAPTVPAVVAASEPVATSLTAKASPPALAQSSVIPPVAEPEPLPKPTLPSPTKPKTIDEQYKARVAKECKSGFAGQSCREDIKFEFCNRQWDEHPPKGRSICKLIE